jgi:hypothetical protein
MVGVEFDLRSALWKYFGQQNKGLRGDKAGWGDL